LHYRSLALYFDIRKDSLYCDDRDSEKRNNCIKLLSIVLEFLLKWMSPILVFTCEEIYQIIKKPEFEKSIFLYSFKKFPSEWINNDIEKKWIFLKKLRSEVNNSIEQKRNEKMIGSSLEANVHIFLNKKHIANLEKIDLAELFLCSEGTLNDRGIQFEKTNDSQNIIDDLKILITKSKGTKCSHCWKILTSKCKRVNCGII